MTTLRITPGSPWKSRCDESVDGSLGDEPLDGGILYSPTEAEMLIEAWRRHYDTAYSSFRA